MQFALGLDLFTYLEDRDGLLVPVDLIFTILIHITISSLPVIVMATQSSSGPDSSTRLSPEASLECLSSFSEKDNACVEVVSYDVEADDRSQDEDDNLVHWDGPGDPQNPLNWGDARKWLTIGLISFSSFNVYAF
jgi:hypothetical protein